MSLDLSNYELLWPASLFMSEGERVLRSTGSWQDRATWLITEALAGTTAVADFEELPDRDAPTDDPWSSTTPSWGSRAGTGKREWFTGLVNRAGELRHAAAPPALLAAAPRQRAVA
ncbi:hypothetical protein GCM10012286_21690 [Streptomyces lasiicapitis]|uniref:Uncharacterized protein n=1 Tax=Streptomyces lasiicapitis TaxID=1923961 RepID=A0ABQ2LPV1_9ACTN|nr:hypothetical protein GCM10012286_21690 [Streptomyces lasiicapitis]